jgi:hypothetical protein
MIAREDASPRPRAPRARCSAASKTADDLLAWMMLVDRLLPGKIAP